MSHQIQLLEESQDIETAWSSFRNAVYTAAEETIGHQKRKRQDWFDDNDLVIKRMLDEKNTAHQYR